MCIFRIMINGRYSCGKRYPLRCSSEICPFGKEIWRMLVNRDFKTNRFWIMPGMREATYEEALHALKAGEAEYVVKAITFSIGGGRGKKHP